MSEEKKKCSCCGVVKYLAYFYKKKTCKDGYSGTCKKCAGVYCKIYRSKNPEKYRCYERNRVIRDPEKKRDSTRKSLVKHSEKYNKRRREKYAENPEKFKIAEKEFRMRNHEKILSSRRSRRLGNLQKSREMDRLTRYKYREKILAREKANYSANPEKYREKSQRIRELKRSERMMNDLIQGMRFIDEIAKEKQNKKG